MTVSERIAANYRRLRRVQGLTLEVAASKARGAGYTLSKSWLSRIENGRAPGEGQLDALAVSIGVDVSMLTMPIPAPADDSTDVQGADVQRFDR